jgi:hypothetical protein
MRPNAPHSISIPSFVFKQDLLEFDENAEYLVDINKIESKDGKKALKK